MRRSRPFLLTAVVAVLSAIALTAPSAGAGAGPRRAVDPLVSVGSQPTIFSRNKQNEPYVAIDPAHPNVLAAGSNDQIDLEACNAGAPNDCPFTPGVGLTGIYFSFDGGASWTQPTYTGWSARACLGDPDPSVTTDVCQPQVGPIGTLPHYLESGMVSNGDPVLAFGPRPGPNGFSWDNGSRLYYANLIANFSTVRGEQAFKGFVAVGVSRTDDPQTAALGGPAGQAAWKPPVIVATRRSSTTFSDKDWIWVDNAASSPHFGNVYVCWVSFRSIGGAPEPVMFSRSTDGGDHWSAPLQLSPAANPPVGLGRQGCQVATDSKGTVYVFWESAIPNTKMSAHFLARSFDGGRSFERGRPIATLVDVGAFDPNQGRFTFDGLGGARTDSFPSVSIANGAPTGQGATDQIFVTWSDGREGLNHEHALLITSTDRGRTWSSPVAIEEPGDRPDFPAISVSPDGQDLYLTYMGFLVPWQQNNSSSRSFQGVVRHADVVGGTPAGWTTLLRGAVGDARGSSANALISEFLGDYTMVWATDDGAVAVWTDARNAADCPAIDAFRDALRTSSPLPRPSPGVVCPDTFGNSDIFGAAVSDPTP